MNAPISEHAYTSYLHGLPPTLARAWRHWQLFEQMMVRGQTYPAGGRDGIDKLEYYNTPEDSYANLAQYYDVPAISFR